MGDGVNANLRRRLQDARQRRQDILRDLRENGWRSLRNGATNAARIVSQAPSKAMQSGKQAARKVLSIQRAAGLNQKLVERVSPELSSTRSRDTNLGGTRPGSRVRGRGPDRVPGILPEPPRLARGSRPIRRTQPGRR